MDAWTVSYLLLWGLVIVNTGVLLVTVRAVGGLFLGTREAIERDGLPIGTTAPDFRATTGMGDTIRLEDLKGKFLALLFATPAC